MLIELNRIRVVGLGEAGAINAGGGCRKTWGRSVKVGNRVLFGDVGRVCICLKVLKEKMFS